MKEAYMAIDAHARRCVLGLMDESGRYLDEWQFPTTESELIRHVAALKAPHKRLAIEEGPLAYWIAQTLRQYVAEVFICAPSRRATYLARVPNEAVRQQLGRLYAVLDAAVAASRQALRARVALGRRNSEIERMQQMPGVGVVGAHVFDAYIQTPARFAGKRPPWRYCRWAIRERSSDGKPLGFARLNRSGCGPKQSSNCTGKETVSNVGSLNGARQLPLRGSPRGQIGSPLFNAGPRDVVVGGATRMG